MHNIRIRDGFYSHALFVLILISTAGCQRSAITPSDIMSEMQTKKEVIVFGRFSVTNDKKLEDITRQCTAKILHNGNPVTNKILSIKEKISGPNEYYPHRQLLYANIGLIDSSFSNLNETGLFVFKTIPGEISIPALSCSRGGTGRVTTYQFNTNLHFTLDEPSKRYYIGDTYITFIPDNKRIKRERYRKKHSSGIRNVYGMTDKTYRVDKLYEAVTELNSIMAGVEKLPLENIANIKN